MVACVVEEKDQAVAGADAAEAECEVHWSVHEQGRRVELAEAVLPVPSGTVEVGPALVLESPLLNAPCIPGRELALSLSPWLLVLLLFYQTEAFSLEVSQKSAPLTKLSRLLETLFPKDVNALPPHTPIDPKSSADHERNWQK